jgi:hypothetical protein
MHDLRFIKPLTWNEVFALWRDGEATIPRWIEHYKNRGFSSWDEWRRNTLKDLQYKSLFWRLFEIEKPEASIPHFFGGPFRAWISNYYHGARTRTFEELANDSKIEGNKIIKQMVSGFPAETHLIGLRADEKVFIIEGMHRCCALALMARRKDEIRSKVLIALAEYSGEILEMGNPSSPT